MVLEVDGAIADAGSTAGHERVESGERREDRAVEPPIVEGAREIFGLAVRAEALVGGKKDAVLDAEAESPFRQDPGIVRQSDGNEADGQP